MKFNSESVFCALLVVSFCLHLWQRLVSARFPLHQRIKAMGFAPAVTLLKPLKGCDNQTRRCLMSWVDQTYPGPMQLLFGIASKEDPVVELVSKILQERPGANARFILCPELRGPNAKVSTLLQLLPHAEHEVLVISDADVLAPPDLVANIVAPLQEERVGLVNCFYRFIHPMNTAMRWERGMVNADFWTQVLQSNSIKAMDFALGATMALRIDDLKESGGFERLVDVLADDYQLGKGISGLGKKIVLSPVVVDCLEDPKDWKAVWAHQVRWARTVRICQPVGYFFSILSNLTLWTLLWFVTQPIASPSSFFLLGALLLFREVTAYANARKIEGSQQQTRFPQFMAVHDLLSAARWAASWWGNTVEWRGLRYKIIRGGRLVGA